MHGMHGSTDKSVDYALRQVRGLYINNSLGPSCQTSEVVNLFVLTNLINILEIQKEKRVMETGMGFE